MGKGALRATPALPLHPALRQPGPRSCSLEMLLGSPAEEPQKSRRGCHGSPTRLAYPACLAANRNQVLGTEVVPNTSDLREPLIHLCGTLFSGHPCRAPGGFADPPHSLPGSPWLELLGRRARSGAAGTALRPSLTSSSSEGARLAAWGEGRASPSSSVPGAM